MYLSNGRAFFIWPFFCQSFISFLSQHSTHPHTSPRLSVFMYIDLDHCVLVFRAIPTPDTHLEWIFYSRRKFHRCFVFLNIFLKKKICVLFTCFLLPFVFYSCATRASDYLFVSLWVCPDMGLCVYVCMHVFVCAILYETVLAFDLTLSE